MPRASALATVEIDIDPEASFLARPDADTPFRIAVLGDFSGRQSRGLCDPKLAGRRPFLVDRDNFDQVMAGLRVELRLPLGSDAASALTLKFAELDEFHPDYLFDHLAPFRALRETRRKLSDPATFAAAAAELGLTEPSAPATHPPPELAALSGGSLLDQMLESPGGPAPVARPSRAPDELQSFIRRIVAPYVVPRPDPRQADVIAEVDAAISGLMRDILHAPAFQALEAAWRGLFFLVRRLETGSDLKVYLVDISREELAADLGSTDDLTRTAAHKLLVDGSVGTPGADPWAVFAGNYVFDASMQSAALLGRIAKIAQAAGAPFVAGASPAILGSESLSGVPDPREWKTGRDSDDVGWWEAIRRLPDSVWLGLALPRFLLRLPYGKDTDSTERFHFEEMPGSPSHEAYLWANASIACAYLLGEAFTNEGWELTPGAIRDISGLPLHIYKEDGQAESKPCAEGLISDRAADAIAAQGLMPLLSRKDDDAVRLAFIRSIAFPPATLRGRWS